jgi:hypothetical protein
LRDEFDHQIERFGHAERISPNKPAAPSVHSATTPLRLS